MKKSTAIISLTAVLIFTAAILAFLFYPREIEITSVTQDEVTQARTFLSGSLANPRYTYVDFLTDNAGTTTPEAEIKAAPAGGTATLSSGSMATFTIDAPSAGLYTFSALCSLNERVLTGLTLAVAVNGETQYLESGNIILPAIWRDQTKDFPVDSFGDETIPEQEVILNERAVDFYNNTYLSDTPLLFRLEKGVNTITIKNESVREIVISELTVKSERKLPSYQEYLASNSTRGNGNGFYNIDTISYDTKNSSYVQLNALTDASVYPTDPVNKKINVLRFEDSGNEATFNIDVAEAGFYQFAVHAKIGNDDFSNFLSFKVDGEIPFAEAASFALQPYADTKWHNQYLQDENGNPYLIYLTEGKHALSLRGEVAPLSGILRDLQLVIDHVNKFSLDIKKITGKQIDKNRTWKFTRNMPETEQCLTSYYVMLRNIAYELEAYSTKGVKSSTISSVVSAIALIEKMLVKPDEIPLYLENLAGKDVSIVLLLGRTMDNLLTQSMTFNSFYVFSDRTELPRENASFFTSTGASAEVLWASFVSPKYVVRNDPEVINIWMNNTAIHVDTLQKLIDTRFTPATGIKARVSIMPDANKLVLSSAAGTNPDIGLGLLSYVPFDLALRDAILDLTQFDDFWEVANRFPAGSMVSFILNDGVYALPESVEFNALVYRTDIFESLGLTPPETWDDVGKMMSELQRFDMSFYMPIASGDGYKWFFQTTPLIYQAGGELYQSDGLGTAIDQPNAVKGITLLGDMFTTYALLEQVPIFFNSFRIAQTPIGILDTSTYLLLRYGAPELAGQWKLGMYPGTEQEDGSIARWFVANGRNGFIFQNSDKHDESWEFMKWWLSEDVQSEFAFNLQSTYNLLWLPSNIDALKHSTMPSDDLQVILNSLEWLRDTPRSPGQYMLERSLSDIWNTMVFDGVPARVAIDQKAIIIQREFKRKMTEFGYIDAQGNKLKDYTVHEIDWVKEQMRRGAAK